MAGAVIQATGMTELEDGLCAGGQLKARNGLQRVRTIPWNDRIPDPPGGRPNSNLAAVRASVVLNHSWCGVRLDHRRREAGLSCIPGLTLVSLLDRVEGCYKCQPLRLEAISHTRDAHFRNIRGHSNNNNNNNNHTVHSAIQKLLVEIVVHSLYSGESPSLKFRINFF